MAWCFGDSFDLYSAAADMAAGYWDSGGSNNITLTAGRFPGSQALHSNNLGTYLTKASGQNDPVHHITVAYDHLTTLGAANKGLYFNLNDGATTQCCIVFQGDGSIALTSAAGGGGTVLATYPGAFNSINAWNSYEFEVVINNTTGSFTVRSQGATSNSFTATGLNTRNGTTNNYANALTIGYVNTVNTTANIDDFLWRSDATSGVGNAAWVGDIRCYARAPASDVQAQFTGQVPASGNQNLGYGYQQQSQTYGANAASFMQFTAALGGMVTGATITVNANVTGNISVAVYDLTGPSNTPGNLLGASTPVTNPVAGTVAFTFPTPFRVVPGTVYAFAVNQNASVQYAAAYAYIQSWQGAVNYSLAYASGWPSAINSLGFTWSGTASPVTANPITIATGNFGLVSEPHQDAATSYIFDSTVGHNDLYSIASIPVIPIATIAVTTRAFAEKSDAGLRSGNVQLKSGSTTVTSPSTALTTAWSWLWRTDVNDPATSAPWTATAVNNVQIGPTVTA